ncbi:XerD Site-specific recombinase XerD [Candidatus Methylopumilus universalis]
MVKEKYHRSTPLPDSFVTIRSYPTTLKLYKTGSSKVYWLRFFYKNKLFRKSSQTENLTIAKDRLINFYNQILENKEVGQVTEKSRYSFTHIATDFFHYQQNLIGRKERNERINSNEKSLINVHIVPYFKQKSIKTITRFDLEDLFSHLSVKSKLKTTSIKKVQNLIKKLFKYAYENNVIDKLPYFPTVSTVDTPRPTFTLAQYKTLIKTSDSLINNKKVIRGHIFREDMKYLIQFMMNTFVRPTDLKYLKHRNIVIEKIFDDAQKRDCLAIYYEHGKTKTRRITYSLESAVLIYQKLITFYKENKEDVKSDDYVFFPKIKNRDFALRTMQRLFNELLITSKLKKSNLNENHSLYSLRHTSISLRIYDGVDINTIARNANTSADMINRFYASHILNKMSAKEIQLRHKTKPSNKGFD